MNRPFPMKHASLRSAAFAVALAVLATLGACKTEKSSLAGANASGTPPSAVQMSEHPAPATAAAVAAPVLGATKAVDLPGLHNVVAYAEAAYGGAQPEGPEAFDTLQALGVKTLVSVDGALPAVAAAEARGMRYIHLPIGYDGFDDARRLALAKALQVAETQGPVYMHCHHGKHRSAGALAAGLITLGRITHDQALEHMKTSSCSPSYKGLWAVAKEAKPVAAEALAALEVELPAFSRPSGMVQGMVELDRYNDYMKEIEKAGWKVPADNPDLVPERVAARMSEMFSTLEGVDATKAKPAEFLKMLRADRDRATELGVMLKAGATPEKLSAKFKELGKSCKDCHATYRD